jgi:Ca2+-binding EF-hand superfamily protein
MDIANKEEFVFFMKRAVEDNVNDSYIELYNILLRAFAKADIDFDGKVSEEEFPGMMTAAAALPSKFGFQWWAGNPSDLFHKIDDNGDGAISFDEWLGYAMNQYKGDVATLPKAPREMSKDEFITMCKESTNTASESFKKVYWFNWKCFQAADADRDGMVAADEFNKMIAVATASQKNLGLPAPYATDAERTAAFVAMDANGDGSISFDEWLEFCGANIIAPVAAL